VASLIDKRSPRGLMFLSFIMTNPVSKDVNRPNILVKIFDITFGLVS
jgi:hypothetical protein